MEKSKNLGRYLLRKLNDDRLELVSNMHVTDIKARIYVSMIHKDNIWRYPIYGNLNGYSLDDKKNYTFTFRWKEDGTLSNLRN